MREVVINALDITTGSPDYVRDIRLNVSEDKLKNGGCYKKTLILKALLPMARTVAATIQNIRKRTFLFGRRAASSNTLFRLENRKINFILACVN